MVMCVCAIEDCAFVGVVTLFLLTLLCCVVLVSERHNSNKFSLSPLTNVLQIFILNFLWSSLANLCAAGSESG